MLIGGGGAVFLCLDWLLSRQWAPDGGRLTGLYSAYVPFRTSPATEEMTLHMIAGLRDVKAADRRFPVARKSPKQQVLWAHPAQILNSIGDTQSIAAQKGIVPC